MSTSNPYPTFATWKDRTTYLIGEYKIPISISVFAGGIWALWARPEIPSPPAWVGAVVLTWALLAIPTFIIARRVVNWLYDPPKVYVGVVRPGDPTIYDLQAVPPDLWSKAVKMDDAGPLPIEEGVADYVVTEFEWLEDIGELRVRGVEPEQLDPGEAYAYHEKVDRYYDQHVDLMAGYSKLKAVSAELIQTGHDDGLMQAIGARDEALAPNVSARELLEEIENSDDLKDPGQILEWEAADPDQDGPPTNGSSEEVTATHD